ncbi:aminotransferase class V-fold PLP-dependent enzyme, partial [Arthrospira platensis SPKY1]|nr:aminotransferase class V-fold PLP-dependent enzyme [Arthrospira platensis SPKY1]
FEQARQFIATYIHASRSHEIIFTRGTTESVNLVAATFGEQLLQKGDKVLITAMEHHSNMVPWQQLCLRKQGHLLVVPMNEYGETDMDHYRKLLEQQPKIVA